jgi:ankyrin repeat protein
VSEWVSVCCITNLLSYIYLANFYVRLKRTPLQCAINSEQWVVVLLLLKHPNVDITLENDDGNTLIHLLVKKCPPDVNPDSSITVR